LNDEDIAAIRHKLWVYGTEDSLAVLGVIRQLEAERDRLRAEVQALARDALGAGCQAWENNTRAVAAEAERDRLRDALRYLHETVDRAFPALSTTPPMVEARAALGDKP
jgi:hypothetical protein